MLSQRELTEAIGTKAYGPDGAEIGRVEHFFVDDRTGAPTWVAVTTGLFGTRHSIVPAVEAAFTDGVLRLPVGKDAVRGAPSPGDTQHLDPDEEAQLRAHYGLGEPGLQPAAADRTQQIDTTAAQPPAPVTERPEPARATPGDGSMVRSEEQLRVATETTAATRMRVVKYVVTEEVQVTVPLRREEIRVEEVPVDAPDVEDETLAGTGRHATAGHEAAGQQAGAGSAVGGDLPGEIVLHREEPVVGVRVVPTERVRLRTEVVQGQEQVSAQVQRERITVDEHPVGSGTDRDTDRTEADLPRRDA